MRVIRQSWYSPTHTLKTVVNRFNRVLMRSLAGALVLFLFLSSNRAAAQGSDLYANNWNFGFGAGMNFTSGTGAFQAGSTMNSFGGCSSISDPATGNLLFYTDGTKVYAANGTTMPNGTGLNGGQFAAQSVVIVPKPGSTTVFYLFTTSASGAVAGLQYSEVDMSLNGGLGDVTTNKNVPLSTPVAERITAIRACDNTNYWVIAHGWNNANFLVYNVTAAGVNTTAVTSNVGLPMPNVVGNFFASLGQMKASPTGKALALVQSGPAGAVQYFDFNNSTGAVSAAVTLPYQDGSYGASFSPDGTKIYTTAFRTLPNTLVQSDLWQYDLFQPAAAPLLIHQYLDTTNFMASLQLGRDGRVYAAVVFLDSMYAINTPNAKGAACNFVENVFPLISSNNRYGLPALVESVVGEPLEAKFFNTTGCVNNPVSFFDSTTVTSPSQYTFTWNFGDPTSGTQNTVSGNGTLAKTVSHTFAAVGQYTVKLTVTDGCWYTDSVTKFINIQNGLPVDLGDDTTYLCAGQSINLSTGITGPDSVRWNTGSTNPILNVSVTGTYIATVYAGNCSGSDTTYVEVNSAPLTVSLGPDTSLCGTGRYTFPLTTNAAFPSEVQYTFSPNSLVIGQGQAQAGAAGTYSVTASYRGCTATASVVVDLSSPPQVLLRADDNITTACEGQPTTLELRVTPSDNADILWSTGEITPDIEVDSAGTYYVTVRRNACLIIDSIVITERCKSQLVAPTAFSPDGDGVNDTFYVWTKNATEVYFRVYDRWGRILFERAADADGILRWDGKVKDTYTRSGRYFWQVSYRDEETYTQELQGLLVIVR